MQKDRLFLILGLLLSVPLGWLIAPRFPQGIIVILAFMAITWLAVYVVFGYWLPYRRMEAFRQGRLFHECQRCGACCHLRVNLDDQDYKAIIRQAKKMGLKETIIEKGGQNYWLLRRKDKGCTFLEKMTDGTTRCAIYALRPKACQLYPLVPSGKRLKADLHCPGFTAEKGKTYREFLESQGVSAYVQRHLKR